MRSQPAELISKIQEPSLVEAVRPIDAGVDPQQAGGIQEAEQILCVRPHTLKGEAAVDLIPGTQSFIEARL